MAERFVLRPRPPVRALALSAGLDLVGAVLIVLGSDAANTLLVVIGVVVLVLGLALLAAALIGYRRFSTVVEMDDRGLAIRSAGKTARRRWNEINQVRAQDHHVYLWTDSDDGETLQIVCPRGPSDPEVGRLQITLARALDADRGYRNISDG